jgi:hypothetical protein
MKFWNRDGVLANMHLMKIHFLFFKLLIMKEFSFLRMRILH